MISRLSRSACPTVISAFQTVKASWQECHNITGDWVSHLFRVTRAYFSTLGDHADHIGFWGEVFDSDDVHGRTSTAMGSGYFAEAGWPWSGYMHNLRAQTMRDGSMADYDGSAEISSPEPDIQGHFLSGSGWGSYVFAGGPGAG
jgi:neprosin-like protein